MREPDPARKIFGLVAEFDEPEALVEAVRRAREAGYVRIEAYSPFPIAELTQALGFREAWVPLACLIGAVVGAAAGYGLQVGANLDFPIDIGGRPLIAPQAFMLITFELMVLFAVVFAVGAMLALNRLPRLNHPLFELDSFHLASSERFFLVIQSNDDNFDPAKDRAFLEGLAALRVDEAPCGEVPQ